jgi:hypothetical protein
VVRSSWDVQFFRLGTISGAGNTYTRLEIPESLKRLAKHLQESITRKTISPNQSLVSPARATFKFPTQAAKLRARSHPPLPGCGRALASPGNMQILPTTPRHFSDKGPLHCYRTQPVFVTIKNVSAASFPWNQLTLASVPLHSRSFHASDSGLRTLLHRIPCACRDLRAERFLDQCHEYRPAWSRNISAEHFPAFHHQNTCAIEFNG